MIAAALSLGTAVQALESVAPAWLAVALALNAASMVVRAIAWLVMLRAALPGRRVRAGVVMRATMIGVVGSALAPARVGEPARGWLVARRFGSPATVVGTMFAQTLLNLLALALLAGAALARGSGLSAGPGAVLATLALPAALVILGVAGRPVALAAARSRRFHRGGAWTVRQLDALRSGLAVFRPAWRGLALVAVQLAAWALQLLAVYALIRALHLPIGLDAAAAILLAVNVTAVVPITPSNIGVFQAACVAVVAAYGVASTQGLAFGVLLQAAELVTALVLGIPALLAEGIGLRALRTRPAAVPD